MLAGLVQPVATVTVAA